jgi:hypothetical protein
MGDDRLSDVLAGGVGGCKKEIREGYGGLEGGVEGLGCL